MVPLFPGRGGQRWEEQRVEPGWSRGRGGIKLWAGWVKSGWEEGWRNRWMVRWMEMGDGDGGQMAGWLAADGMGWMEMAMAGETGGWLYRGMDGELSMGTDGWLRGWKDGCRGAPLLALYMRARRVGPLSPARHKTPQRCPRGPSQSLLLLCRASPLPLSSHLSWPLSGAP